VEGGGQWAATATAKMQRAAGRAAAGAGQGGRNGGAERPFSREAAVAGRSETEHTASTCRHQEQDVDGDAGSRGFCVLRVVAPRALVVPACPSHRPAVVPSPANEASPPCTGVVCERGAAMERATTTQPP
jgi:hypothetical protein